MVKLRKFCAYRKLERAYTRRSKFREQSYIKTKPNLKIVRFDMGTQSKKFQYTLNLRSGAALQIRHNALESARQTSNKVLEEEAGKNGYFMRIRVYPHHILRENPLASGAGADRMSTGMQLSFGKPIGAAARIKKDQIIISLKVDEPHLKLGRRALTRAMYKLPCSGRIETIKNE